MGAYVVVDLIDNVILADQFDNVMMVVPKWRLIELRGRRVQYV